MTTYWGKSTIYEYLAQDIPNGTHTFMTGPTQQIAISVRIYNNYGDLTIASTNYVASSSGSGAIDILKVYGTLTITPGANTPIFNGANNGTIIYTTNDLILDGKITRKAISYSVADTVICPDVYLFKLPDGALEYIPGVGGVGGSAPYSSTNSGSSTYGANGGAGGATNVLTSRAYRSTGGGGAGAIAYRRTASSYVRYGYRGYRGTSYSGGQAGRADYWNNSTGTDTLYGGGPLGGGNLTIYCDGDFLVSTTGYLDVSGGDVTSYRYNYFYNTSYAPGRVTYDGGGGGGSLNVFYQGKINGTVAQNTAKFTARGGTSTVNTTVLPAYTHHAGGAGGAGHVNFQKMSEIKKDRIVILDDNMLPIEGVGLGRVIQGSYTKTKRIFLENRYYQTVNKITLTWDYNEDSEDKSATLEFSKNGVDFSTDRTIVFDSPLQPGRKHTFYVRGLATPEQVYDTNFDFDIETTA